MRVKISERWKAETPKLYKVLGWIGVVIALIGSVLTGVWNEYTELQQYLPAWVPVVVTGIGFTGKIVCKLQYVKNLYDSVEDKIIAKDDENKN